MSQSILIAGISVGSLVQLFPWLFVLLGAALIWLWRRSEKRRRLLPAIILFALLWIFCMPLTSYLALGSLEWRYPPAKQRPPDLSAIVVLSGGITYGDDVVSQAILSEDTVERCLEAGAVYHAGPRCTMLLSGGKVDSSNIGPQLAEAMRDLMLRLGVAADDIVLESNSRTTYENAVESTRLLKQFGASRVLLVTDAAHLPRATRCFRRQGIEVIPWGCRRRARGWKWSPMVLIPHAGAAQGTQAALHEWLGLAWYWLYARI